MKTISSTCTSGGPYEKSDALPYSTLRPLGEQTDSACGEPLYLLNGALVCQKCDLLPREKL